MRCCRTSGTEVLAVGFVTEPVFISLKRAPYHPLPCPPGQAVDVYEGGRQPAQHIDWRKNSMMATTLRSCSGRSDIRLMSCAQPSALMGRYSSRATMRALPGAGMSPPENPSVSPFPSSAPRTTRPNPFDQPRLSAENSRAAHELDTGDLGAPHREAISPRRPRPPEIHESSHGKKTQIQPVTGQTRLSGVLYTCQDRVGTLSGNHGRDAVIRPARSNRRNPRERA